jgi:30S ribosomal protein 3
LSKFYFKVIWLNHSIGISVDKKLKNNFRLPITSFFFWPRVNGWKLLKHQLELKPWLKENERITIINGYTKILYCWKDNFKNLNTINIRKIEKELNFILVGME